MNQGRYLENWAATSLQYAVDNYVLPDDVRRGLATIGITLSRPMLIVESPGLRWRLLDLNALEVRAWRLEIANAAQSETRALLRRNKAPSGPQTVVEISQYTDSGLSPVLWDYPVFYGVMSADGSQIELINGHGRMQLPPETRHRWDYHFRPELDLVGSVQQRTALAYERLAEMRFDQAAKMRKHSAIIGGVSLLALILGLARLTAGGASAVAQGIVCILASLYAAWVAARKWFENYQAQKQAQGFLGIAERRRSEVAELKQQVVEPPSHEEVDRELRELLLVREAAALRELNLDDPTVSTLSLRDELKHDGQFKTMSFKQPASFQDPKTAGLDIARQAAPDDLNAVPVFADDNEPRVPIMLVQFIIPASDQLATYGFIYDYLRDHEYGATTNEYYYRSVVSVKTTTETAPPNWFRGTTTQLKKFSLTVASSDSIDVSVVDHLALSALDDRLSKLRAQLRQQREAEIQRAAALRVPIPDPVATADFDGRALFVDELTQEMATEREPVIRLDDDQPITQTEAAVQYIRGQMRRHTESGQS